MKPKLLQVRVDDEFLSMLEYLKQTQGSKSMSDTIRKIVKNEYQREMSPIKDDILYCHRSKRTFKYQFCGDTLWNRSLSQVISICKFDQPDARPWLIIKKTSHYDIIGELDENGEYKEV